MKKQYMKPEIEVINIETTQILCASVTVAEFGEYSFNLTDGSEWDEGYIN